MDRKLDVYLDKSLVGELIQDVHGNLGFKYDGEWLENPNAIVLSQSLPLRTEPFTRNECRGFFGGILPEANQRSTIARNLGISDKNDFAMLEQIGGECAGAVTFMPSGKPLPEDDHSYLALDETKLADILRGLPQRPLLAGEEGIRLSLAGAQSKLAVHKNAQGKISIPLGGAPSTHILKPATSGVPDIVFNEAFCMKLAHSLNLNTAVAEIGRVEDIDYLLVERYDRKIISDRNAGTSVIRLHQEDFCQALGIVSENKYQNEGGASLKNCFDLLRSVASSPIIDLQSLLKAAIFNFLIGNNDAHSKNFSLLYDSDQFFEKRVRFAPLYDLICTAYYPKFSPKMAMKIGSQYHPDDVLPRHFETLAEEAGLSKPMLKKQVTELSDKVLTNLAPLEDIHESCKGVAEIIRKRCMNTIRLFQLETDMQG